MGEEVILYSMPDCEVCASIKRAIVVDEERSLADLAAGKIQDAEALSQLQMQGGKAPVLLIGGVAVPFEKVEEMSR